MITLQETFILCHLWHTYIVHQTDVLVYAITSIHHVIVESVNELGMVSSSYRLCGCYTRTEPVVKQPDYIYCRYLIMYHYQLHN